MKKAIFLGCIGLLFALISVVSYAAMTKTPISPSDLPALKGKWVGTRIAGTTPGGITELDIENDTPPLQGKLTVHNVIVRGSRGRTVTLEFKNGQIDKQGNLVIKKEKNEFEFSLYEGEGKMKLEGDYYFMGVRGKITLQKK